MTAINGPIRPKRSTVAGETPQASDLVAGEIAVNTADGKLFVKHTDDTVKEISGGGGAVEVPSVRSWVIASDSTKKTALTLSAPTTSPGDLLIACIVTRESGGAMLSIPAGFTLYGEYLSLVNFEGDAQTISVYTKQATESEPNSYTFTEANEGRFCGFIAAVAGSSDPLITSVRESYDTSKSISTDKGVLNLTAATWIFTPVSGDETYSQTGVDLTEITDSPEPFARISGGYTASEGVVTMINSQGGGQYSYGIINIQITATSSVDGGATSIFGLTDVDSKPAVSIARYATVNLDSLQGSSDDPGEASLPVDNRMRINNVDSDGLDFRAVAEGIVGSSVGDLSGVDIYISRDKGTTFTAHTGTVRLISNEPSTVRLEDLVPVVNESTAELRIALASDPAQSLVQGDTLVWSQLEQAFAPGKFTTTFSALADVTATDTATASIYALDTLPGYTGGRVIFQPNSSSVYGFAGLSSWDEGHVTLVGGSSASARSCITLRSDESAYFHPDAVNGGAVPSNYTIKVECNGEDGQTVLYRTEPTLGTGTSDLVVPSMGQVRAYADSVGGGGAVDSVNGETGAVSLGIQDMDDFSLLADDGLDVGTYNTFVGDATNLYNTPGGAGIDFGNRALPLGYLPGFSQLDADGVDRKAEFEAIDEGPVWVSVNGLPFVQAVGDWKTIFNGYLGVDLDGSGAAPDGTVINEVKVTTVEPGIPQPLEDGDYLRWNTSSQLFSPAQLATVATTGSYNDLTDQPTIPAEAPVDSVNGETGAISLGIQDMDDFSLLADDGLDVGTYDTFVTTANDLYNTPGSAGIDFGTATLPLGYLPIFSQLGADGVDRKAQFETISETPVWVSVNGLPFVQTVGDWEVSFNGYLEVVLDGSGAAPDGTVINEVRITTVQPGTPQPLEDGDYLRWNANSQLFLPAQLATVATTGSYNDLTDQPSIPGEAPVDSVNDQTGVVSLGIRDMDDYAPVTVDGITQPFSERVSSVSAILNQSQWYMDSWPRLYVKSDAASMASVQAGDTLTFQLADSDNQFTCEVDSVVVASGTQFRRMFRFTDDNSVGSELINAPNGAELLITGPTVIGSLGDYALPLNEGDILQWDGSDQKFKPAQLATVASTGSYNDLTDTPTIPDGGIEEAPEDGTPYVRQDAGWVSAPTGGGGAVDSVNGETGAVSLGVQDMDDFYTAPILVQTVRLVIKNSGAGQGECAWLTSSGDPGIRFGGTEDADGINLLDYFATFEDGSTMWYSVDEGSTYSTTVASFKDYNGGTRNMIISSTLQGVAYNNNGSSLYLSVADPTGEVPNKLVDGTVLVWNDFIQKFKPTQLATVANTGSYNDLSDQPAIPGPAPVDSVNGETGDVSLGIQDQNDFKLNLYVPSGSIYRYDSVIPSGDCPDLLVALCIFDDGATLGAVAVDVATEETDPDFAAKHQTWAGFEFSTAGVDGPWTSTGVVSATPNFYGCGGTRFEYNIASVIGGAQTVWVREIGTSDPQESPLAEGDILQWNSLEQKFKPAQLATVASTGSYNDLSDQPTIPAEAPVDSVNGETGAVSLGIQDMDDFGTAKSLFFDEYKTSWTGGTSGAYRVDDSNPLAIRFATRINSVPVNDEMTGLSGSDVFLAYGSTVIGPMTATITQTNTAYTLLTSPSLTSEITAEIEAWGLSGGGIYFISSALTSPEAENFIADGDVLQWNGSDQKFKPVQVADIIPASLEVDSIAAATAIGAPSVVGTNVVAANSSQVPTVALLGETGVIQGSFLTDGTNVRSVTDILASQEVLKAVVAASTDFADFQQRIANL